MLPLKSATIPKSKLENVLPKTEKIMLFELSVGGHYPEYISHLIRYFCHHQLKTCLTIVVSPEFIHRHTEVLDLSLSYDCDRLNFITISQEEADSLKSFRNPIQRNLRAWQEFKIIRKYAIKLQATKIFLPYFDTRQMPIFFGSKLPSQWSGIYFRPSFHYENFTNHHAQLKDKLQSWREKLILAKVLKNKQLKSLFCLDPFAISPINKLSTDSKAIYLPDPVKIENNIQQNNQKLQTELGIEPSRKVFLLFGDLSRRKGIEQLLQAIPLISFKLYPSFCLLLVGSMSTELKQQLNPEIARLNKTFPIQIITHNEYIPESKIADYFQLADVVLATYQRHVGMSGILNRAAVVQKPVLATNYGLMGELVARYQLGLTVDSTNPKEIAQGIEKLLTTNLKNVGDRNLMKQFAQQNDPDKFAQIIFNNI